MKSNNYNRSMILLGKLDTWSASHGELTQYVYYNGKSDKYFVVTEGGALRDEYLSKSDAEQIFNYQGRWEEFETFFHRDSIGNKFHPKDIVESLKEWRPDSKFVGKIGQGKTEEALWKSKAGEYYIINREHNTGKKISNKTALGWMKSNGFTVKMHEIFQPVRKRTSNKKNNNRKGVK